MNAETIRLSFFAGIFLLMTSWEIIAPRRQLTTSKTIRWLSNLGLIMINTGLLAIIPLLPLTLAVFAQNNGWGLLNYYQLSPGLALVISVVLFDLIIYLQHVMFHAIPLLWQLHLVHHADLDYDVTTGLRFHPVEILISIGIKLAAVAVIGPPPLAVVTFEVILNGMAMFNHGNVGLGKSLDSLLRLLVVTQDMHRVHHSVIIRETNSNFGFNLSCWDRIFGTYRPEPAAGQLGMTIGLAQFRDPKRLTLPSMLILPLTDRPGNYSLSRQGQELKSKPTEKQPG